MFLFVLERLSIPLFYPPLFIVLPAPCPTATPTGQHCVFIPVCVGLDHFVFWLDPISNSCWYEAGGDLFLFNGGRV